ncbi:hypothetical protein BDA99DRAFT_515975 [Phascolomyces articulosus]|uniref:NELF-A N-terminal domain-containing protein n=1 Tax=Phascolomyces articulosus TaxID=60185 RepID=A0AAD5JW32_9FUNG|nr:hypothetical protein BDA99DRAFT_515975 [Phascolomyces articulosus]
MERNTPDGTRTWLSEEFNRPGWHSARVAQELSNEVLNMVLMRYHQYPQAAKLGLLFALLYVRKSDFPRMQVSIHKILAQAKQDTDDWVRTTAHILDKVSENRVDDKRITKLNMDVETCYDAFGTLLNDISNGVKEHGISFHANEYAVMIPEIREECIYGTEVYKSNRPTLKQHFTLRTPSNQTLRAEHRKKVLQALVDKERAEMTSPTSPTKTTPPASAAATPVTGMTRPLPGSSTNIHGPAAKRQAIAPPSQNLFINRGGGPQQGGMRRPPPSRPTAPGAASLFNTRAQARPMAAPAPGASSMFIPSRKGSLGGARPAPVRSVLPITPTSASASSATANQPPTPTTPKGFQKQSRVQMLDFTESNKMLQDNNRNIDEAEKRLKGQREQQKHENALRRQQQREEEAKWKASAKSVKRQRTSTTSTAVGETSQPPSPTHPTSSRSPSQPSSPTLPSDNIAKSPTPTTSSLPPNDANDENYLQDPSRTFKGNPSSSSSMAV